LASATYKSFCWRPQKCTENAVSNPTLASPTDNTSASKSTTVRFRQVAPDLSLTRHPREGCASEAGGWGTFTALRIPAAGFANTRATERRARNAHQQPRNSQVKNA